MMYRAIAPLALFAKNDMTLGFPFLISLKKGVTTLALNVLVLTALKYSTEAQFIKILFSWKTSSLLSDLEMRVLQKS